MYLTEQQNMFSTARPTKKQNTHTGLTEELKPQQIYPNCVGIIYGMQGYPRWITHCQTKPTPIILSCHGCLADLKNCRLIGGAFLMAFNRLWEQPASHSPRHKWPGFRWPESKLFWNTLVHGRQFTLCHYGFPWSTRLVIIGRKMATSP